MTDFGVGCDCKITRIFLKNNTYTIQLSHKLKNFVLFKFIFLPYILILYSIVSNNPL